MNYTALPPNRNPVEATVAAGLKLSVLPFLSAALAPASSFLLSLVCTSCIGEKKCKPATGSPADGGGEVTTAFLPKHVEQIKA